ncbi:hypothetical protein V8G54_023920 [Vigna mungo]|uniref:Integrase catalytic domain-containing protein n=1 Tax=Vigna mungo TaxID=3915 RepID=A0AAQ3RPN0_VIGMU
MTKPSSRLPTSPSRNSRTFLRASMKKVEKTRTVTSSRNRRALAATSPPPPCQRSAVVAKVRLSLVKPNPKEEEGRNVSTKTAQYWACQQEKTKKNWRTELGLERNSPIVILLGAGSDRRCKRHGAGGTDKGRLLAGFQWNGHMNESNIHRNERDLETCIEILGWVTFREVFPESVRVRTKHTGKSRSDVWGQSTVPAQFSSKIKILRFDKYTSHLFQEFLQSNGILSQRSCPPTPQQNGVAKRKNRHLLDVVRTFLLESHVPSRFWCEALSTAVHLINRLPSPSIRNESPFTRLFGHPPNYPALRIFGCACYVHLPPHERTKLTTQSVECAFLGYSPHQKGFLCYDPNLHRIRVSRNVIFLESVYFFANHHDSFSSPISVLPLFSTSSAGEILPLNMTLHNPMGPFKILPWMLIQYKLQNQNQLLYDAVHALTWDIVPCPPSVKPLGNKFVFSIKLRSDGCIDRYKARLVVLGNKQEYGLDYDETFASVAKMTTVRTILALAASKSWPLHQMDVKNAFLHGDLKEEVYITLPGGIVWFEMFRSTLLGFSFNQSQYDPSLFLQRTPKGIVVLLVYVDDIVVTGFDQDAISRIKQMLNSNFHMKELGHLNYFLGLEVHYHPEGIFVNRHKYIQDLVQLAGLTNATPVDTPMEVNVKYRRHEGELLDDPTQYRKLVGSLIYVTITRPDISYDVHTVSKFMQSPRHFHFSAVQHIIKYFLGTSSRGLFFPGKSSLQLQAYNDADWAGCLDTRRSTIGWCMFLGNAPISWKCKKQDSVSKSSTELCGLLTELGVSQAQPTPLHADNTSAIQIAANPVYHERTKHIEVDCHSIREAYDRRVITLPHVSTVVQIADIFTKSLPRQRHNFLLGKLMLVDSPASI